MLWKGLGGPDFNRFEIKQLNSTEQTLPGCPGYRATFLFHTGSCRRFLFRLPTSEAHSPHIDQKDQEALLSLMALGPPGVFHICRLFTPSSPPPPQYTLHRNTPLPRGLRSLA